MGRDLSIVRALLVTAFLFLGGKRVVIGCAKRVGSSEGLLGAPRLCDGERIEASNPPLSLI
jgi:hypothetical protein